MSSRTDPHQHSDICKSRGRPSSVPPATTLAALRGARRLTLRDIEHATGVNVAVWSQIERGLMVPQPKHLAALSAVFAVPVSSWRVRFVLETEAVQP